MLEQLAGARSCQLLEQLEGARSSPASTAVGRAPRGAAHHTGPRFAVVPGVYDQVFCQAGLGAGGVLV